MVRDVFHCALFTCAALLCSAMLVETPAAACLAAVGAGPVLI